jgi:hypothetical protein
LVFSNLPNIRNKLSENIAFRDAFFDIDKTLVEDMKQVIYEGEMVAFLPYRNDFFINYLASRIKIQSYNIGGDKNLFEAKKHWPSTMGQFRMGQVDQGFADRVILLLARGEADAVVLPYIDLLWAAHAWPAPLKFKNEVEPVVAKLRDSSFIEIDEREQYTIVRLAAPFVGQKHSGDIEILLRKVLCIEPECLQYVGKESIPSQVGSHTGSGMQTDGRAGFLMFGPYQQINSGVYTLRVTGRVNANGEKAVVDVAGNRGKKIFARFEGLSLPENSTLAENIVLEEQVTIDETVGDLEVRILVDEQADIFISGYSLRPTATPAAQ